MAGENKAAMLLVLSVFYIFFSLSSAIDLLQNLARGSITQSKLEALVAQQKKDIDNALKCKSQFG